MTPIDMPQVGQNIPRARIIEWVRREGDTIQKNEVIATVESDKATFEVQAERAGVLLKIVIPAGEEGDVFKPIAWLGQPGEQFLANVPVSPSSSPAAAPQPKSAEFVETAGIPAPGRLFASPAARRVARERGLELSAVRGTGPGGRIVKADVLAADAALKSETLPAEPVRGQEKAGIKGVGLEPAFAAAGATAGAPPTADQVLPFSRMRQRIAERLTLSKQTIPHFYLSQEVDMTEAQQWRSNFNRVQRSRVTVTELVIYATSRALVEFRRLNARVEKDRLQVCRAVNMGVATAVEDGLLTPVIADADRKSLLEISQRAKQNSENARRGVVESNIPGTFTITSLGQLGIPAFLPIINPPECAILAVGAIQPRVVPIAGGIGVRQMMSLNLACDHRAVDGEYAARFLARLKELLENSWRSGERGSTSIQSEMAESSNPDHALPGETVS